MQMKGAANTQVIFPDGTSGQTDANGLISVSNQYVPFMLSAGLVPVISASVGVAAAATPISTVGNGTLTAAGIAGGLINRSGPTAAFTDTTDTAANIIAAAPGVASGGAFPVVLNNTTAFPMTLAAGASVTLAGIGIVPPNSSLECRCWVTGASTVTLTGVVVAEIPSPVIVKSNALNSVGAGALTAAAIVQGLVVRGGAQGGTAFTDTTDTAANIIAAWQNAQVGMTFYLDILNTTNAQQTLAAGAGVTLTGVSQIGQNCRGTFLVTYTGAGAVSIFGMSIVDRGIDNFNAVADPAVGNDNTQGYGVGSLWFNTTAGALRMWECRDASTGAAKWVFSGADFTSGGTEPNISVIQMGSGTALCAGEGNINRQCPGVAGGVAPGSTGNDNVVAVYSVPANTLDAALRMLTVQAWVQFAANGNTKRAKLWFNATTAVLGSAVTGGTLMADTGAVTQNGGSALLSGSVVKRGGANSNTQTVLPEGVSLSGSHAGLSTPAADTTATENAVILIALTINNTTTATDALGVALQVNGMN